MLHIRRILLISLSSSRRQSHLAAADISRNFEIPYGKTFGGLTSFIYVYTGETKNGGGGIRRRGDFKVRIAPVLAKELQGFRIFES